MILTTTENEKNEEGYTYTVHRAHHGRWAGLVEEAEKGKSSLDNRVRQSRDPDKGWAGVETFKEAICLAKDGWKDGESKAAELSAPIIDEISQLIEREEFVHDVEGSGIDVARYVEGEPECFTRFENRITDGIGGRKLIRLVFNVAVSGSIDQDVITAKGAAVAALIETLELAGNRVELSIVEACRNGEYLTEEWAIVKNFDQPIDASLLIYCLAHPSCLRVIFFSIEECLPKEIVRQMGFSKNGSYGTPSEVHQKKDRGDIYIGSSLGSDPQWKDKEQAEAWVLDQLKKQGVQLKKREVETV